MTIAAAPRRTAAAGQAAAGQAAAGHRIGVLDTRVLVLVALSLSGLAGCGTISEQTAETALVAPGRYTIYTCGEIESRMKSSRARALELEQVMARSAQATGGEFINVIAYRSEYLQVRGQLRAMAETAAERNCQSQSQWSSERSVF